MDAVSKAGTSAKEQLSVSAEIWDLIVGTSFPIHQLDPKYAPLISPIPPSSSDGNPSSGGYAGGDRIIITPHTGGSQLDEPKTGGSYETPSHVLNPGAMYTEKPTLVTNGKHVPGQPGYNPNAGTQPDDYAAAFDTAIRHGNAWYAKSTDGRSIYRYFSGNDGTVHWTGSTRDESSPLEKKVVPAKVLRELGFKAKGSNQPW